MSKANGKKRQSPSVERQLALALVAVLDQNVHDSEENGTAEADARKLLKDAGYGDLESIPSRRLKLEAAIKDAIAAGEWDKVGKLSAEMKRAERGLPPLTTEKKPRAPRKAKTPKPETAEKKSRRKKGAADPLPLGEAVPCQCVYPGCAWKGEAVVDSACPVCGSAVVIAGSEAQ